MDVLANIDVRQNPQLGHLVVQEHVFWKLDVVTVPAWISYISLEAVVKRLTH